MGSDKQINYVRSLAEQAGVDHIDYADLYDADNEAISKLINELWRTIRRQQFQRCS
jgi:tRNA(Ile)-lysidine synthase TilS/MesJ